MKAATRIRFVYFVPGLAGAAMLVFLGAASPWLKSVPARLGAAFAATLCVCAAVAFGKPICFLDPYAGIDPLLRDVWLKHVEEALPFYRYVVMRPAAAIIMLMPVLLGFAAAVAACRVEKGLARLRWLTIVSLARGRLASVFLADPHFQLRRTGRVARRRMGDRPLA